MVEIQVEYEGQWRCRVEHGPSGATLPTDAPVDIPIANRGPSEAFSATDLVAAALGTCVLTAMGVVAQRQGIDLRGAKLRVRKEMTAQAPWRITRLAVEVHVPQAVGEEDRRRLEQVMAICPVKHALHPDIQVPVTFVWGERG